MSQYGGSAISAGQYIGANTPAGPVSQVQAALERLEASVAALGESHDRLANRISNVVSPTSPSPAGETKAPNNDVPLAASINRQSAIIASLAARLNDLISRIEL